MQWVMKMAGHRLPLDEAIGEALNVKENCPPPFAPTKAERGKPKRKLSAWNKFVKANSKKPRFRLRSGSPNLKKLGVAFRKTPAGRKKRR